MGHRAAADSAQQAAGAATGQAALRVGTAVQRAGTALEQRGVTSAPAVGAAVGSTVEALLDAADAVGDAVGTVGSRARHVGAGLAHSVGGFVEDPTVRAGAAIDALRGVPVGPPAAVRRWPWALGAAVVGGAAGAAIAVVLRRLQVTDAPGAQDPDELQAVVDLPVGHPADADTVLDTPSSPA